MRVSDREWSPLPFHSRLHHCPVYRKKLPCLFLPPPLVCNRRHAREDDEVKPTMYSTFHKDSRKDITLPREFPTKNLCAKRSFSEKTLCNLRELVFLARPKRAKITP